MSKPKESDTVNAVFDYLNKQNRPYSAVDIFNNLHKEHGKTAVQKALDNLTHNQKIIEKTYGKQKVYVIDQSKFPSVSEEELKSLDFQIQKKQDSIKTIQQDVRTLEAELDSLNSSLTTAEIKAQIEVAKGEVERMKTKLADLSKNRVQISAATKEKICKENEVCVKEWRKRKRITMDMANAILEGYPKGKKALFEEVGIETDEDAKVKLPEK